MHLGTMVGQRGTAMDLSDIERLAACGESETLEFKKSTGELREAAETLCGFLNGAGGTVIFGITAGGRVVGQDVADHTLQEVAHTLRKFEPPATINIVRLPLPDGTKAVLVLQALPSVEAIPFVYDGRSFQRIGTTTSIMPQERYQQLLRSRLHSRFRWETTVASGVDVDDLDQEEILRTVRVGVAAGRLPETTGERVPDILDRLGLRERGQLLNAAVVLFGKQFLPHYPQCQLRLARFKGTDKAEFLDNRQVYGHALDLLEEAMLFMQRHLPVAGRIAPGVLERIDTPLFPLVALREAVVNALCHRDYSIPGGAVSIAIYDDRLEVWSAGTLPFGLHVEDLKRDHQSRPRNLLIAGVLYRRGLVEQWGRGTQNIVELCVEAGHPEPEFVEQAGDVGVRFLPSGYIAPHRVGHDLTPRQREILHVLAKEGPMAISEIRATLNNSPSERSVQMDLGLLRRLNLVDSAGRGRAVTHRLRR